MLWNIMIFPDVVIDQEQVNIAELHCCQPKELTFRSALLPSITREIIAISRKRVTHKIIFMYLFTALGYEI